MLYTFCILLLTKNIAVVFSNGEIEVKSRDLSVIYEVEIKRIAEQKKNEILEEVKNLIEKSEENIFRMEYERALTYLESASKKILSIIPETPDAPILAAHVYFLKGNAFLFMGDLQKAQDNYTSSLFFNPELTSTHPKIQEVLNTLKRKIENEIKENVYITSYPNGANVWLDGSLIGKTPIDVKLEKSGEHILILKKNGYEIGIHGLTANRKEQIFYLNPLQVNEILDMSYTFDIEDLAEKLCDFFDNIFFVKEKIYVASCITKEIHIFEKNKLSNDIYNEFVKEQQSDTEPKLETKPFYKKWWFWTVVSGIVATGTTALIYYSFYSSADSSSQTTTIKFIREKK